MALYKRGTIWWMSFQQDKRHVQRSTKCKNKRDAEAFERAFRTKLAMGEVGLDARPPAPAFVDAVAEYLSWARMEHGAKPNTVRSYVSTSNALLTFFGNKPIDEIDAVDVEKFKEWRSSQSTRPRSKKATSKVKASWKPTKLKPATINRELALLKIIFNFYIRRDVLVKNPVSKVKLFAENNGQIRVVSVEEETLYLMAASQPLQDFATIMVDTGMRPEEVSKIERRNVDLERAFVNIPSGKTKAAKRRIPLTERAVSILRSRAKATSGQFLFENPETGTPITTLKTAHAGAIKRSCVENFRMYDLRHTFATRFLESGGDLITLQAILGHSNIQMVTRYAHPTEQHQFEAIKRMEAARNKPTAKIMAFSA